MFCIGNSWTCVTVPSWWTIAFGMMGFIVVMVVKRWRTWTYKSSSKHFTLWSDVGRIPAPETSDRMNGDENESKWQQLSQYELLTFRKNSHDLTAEHRWKNCFQLVKSEVLLNKNHARHDGIFNICIVSNQNDLVSRHYCVEYSLFELICLSDFVTVSNKWRIPNDWHNVTHAHRHTYTQTIFGQSLECMNFTSFAVNVAHATQSKIDVRSAFDVWMDASINIWCANETKWNKKICIRWAEIVKLKIVIDWFELIYLLMVVVNESINILFSIGCVRVCVGGTFLLYSNHKRPHEMETDKSKWIRSSLCEKKPQLMNKTNEMCTRAHTKRTADISISSYWKFISK